MLQLKPLCSAGGRVEQVEGVWRLSIPAGDGRVYRVAQLDDYAGLARRRFAWRAPCELCLRARASGAGLPGTWGFGLWNDPFSMGAMAGAGLRLPALPNTAWFFFASPENYLSLHDDLPANGALAAVFRSPPAPGAWLAAGAPALPLLLWRSTTRLLRRIGRRFTGYAAASLPYDPTAWHTYRIQVSDHETIFRVDEQVVLRTALGPRGPLGLVIWIDNQYMALPPSGQPAYGWLANPEAWIEVDAG